MKRSIPLFLLSIISFTGCSKSLELTPFTYHNDNVKITDNMPFVIHENAHVVFLFGQSNADGVSSGEYLAKNNPSKYTEYVNGYHNVYINYVNDNYITSSNSAFIKCVLGCGCAPSYFGPEMGIAEKMSLAYPKDKIFIVKWTWGGTTLDNQWLNGKGNRGDLYNSAMDFSLKCLSYLKSKGYSLTIDGITWMQGENDSRYKDENRYYVNTKNFVTLLRYDLHSYQEKIRFVDAGINEESGIWVKPECINNAKKKFQKESDLNYYIDPTELGLTSKQEPSASPDYAHFDSLSMVKLGQAFGEIVSK